MIGLENTDSPRHEFCVHQVLIDELCHPLCDELRKYWKVFDGETVGRFAQYLYRADCDYLVPAPAGATVAAGVISGGPQHAPASPVTIGDVPTNACGGAELSPAFLLIYARLYILSYSQGINALSDLCISRLRCKLGCIFSPPVNTRILESVVALLRYAHCCPRDVVPPKPLQPAWAELEGLVSEFCALNIDAMEGNLGFLALLRENGALAVEILAKTVRRQRLAEAVRIKANSAAATAEAKKVKPQKADSGEPKAKKVKAKKAKAKKVQAKKAKPKVKAK